MTPPMKNQKMKSSEIIASALKTTYSPNVVLYWDKQDPQNPGPAYRLSRDNGGESGSLDVTGWAHVSGRKVEESEVAGYNIADYFTGADGAYAGPDQDGIYPVLS